MKQFKHKTLHSYEATGPNDYGGYQITNPLGGSIIVPKELIEHSADWEKVGDHEPEKKWSDEDMLEFGSYLANQKKAVVYNDFVEWVKLKNTWDDLENNQS